MTGPKPRFVVIVHGDDDEYGEVMIKAYGPFQSEPAATTFKDAVQRRIKNDASDNGSRHVFAFVAPLRVPRVLTTAKRANEWIVEGNE